MVLCYSPAVQLVCINLVIPSESLHDLCICRFACSMAKSTNHTAHNQSYKNHRNGIKKPDALKKGQKRTLKGVRSLQFGRWYTSNCIRNVCCSLFKLSNAREISHSGNGSSDLLSPNICLHRVECWFWSV
eukprot:6178285-Pleurochrysis_carterae.AAC.1